VLEHHHTIRAELICHMPYAILSVALSIIAVSLLSNMGMVVASAKRLFHTFHFLHILFAATGAVLTFRKYSRSFVGAIAVGSLVPAIFCTLSDSVLPFIGGKYFRLDMHFHWCFIHHLDLIIPFLVVGMINGYFMASHSKNRQWFYSASIHFAHIFISSMASILYLVGYGFDTWYNQIGLVFVFLIIAVLLPCTLSDIVVPMGFAMRGTKAVRGGCVAEGGCDCSNAD